MSRVWAVGGGGAEAYGGLRVGLEPMLVTASYLGGPHAGVRNRWLDFQVSGNYLHAPAPRVEPDDIARRFGEASFNVKLGARLGPVAARLIHTSVLASRSSTGEAPPPLFDIGKRGRQVWGVELYYGVQEW